MQHRLGPGAEAWVETTVTPEMTAHLGGQAVHPVLGTAHLVEWMEWAGRRLIVPDLDAEEDAVGYAIAVEHWAPTLVGERFRVVAVFDRYEGRRLLAQVRAENARGPIGRGEFVQVVVNRAEYEARLRGLIP